jgi:predicted small lipoprotein YifL
MPASLTALARLLLIVSALALAGCGLKGELYLPETAAGESRAEQSGGEDADRDSENESDAKGDGEDD